jgi:pimeloyl-ACP methyl ester carboxylesterase
LDPNIENHIKLTSGFQLCYACYGQKQGIPAFYFHGLPGSRREAVLMHQACLELGVQLIAPDRPGYGFSQADSAIRLEHWPKIVAEVADRLGFSRFYLFAVSGGGPYALACACMMPQRILGTGICCSLAEVANTDLYRSMSGFARVGFWMAKHSPGLLKYSYGSVITAAAKLAPRLAIELLARLQGQPDRSVLSQPEIKSVFANSLHEAFRHGSNGGVADMRAAVQPWRFDLSIIKSLHLWHGTDDHVVPMQHSKWLTRVVPVAKLHVIEGEGHFSLPIHFATTIVKTVLVK